MKNFIHQWFWIGGRKYLLLTSLGGVITFGFAFIFLVTTKSALCSENDQGCFDLFLHTLGKPLYGGYLLKAIIIAPLFLLFSTRLAFRVWAWMSVVVIPLAFYNVLVHAPIYGDYYNKLGMSNFWGMAYFALSLAIAVGVPLIEYAVRRLRA